MPTLCDAYTGTATIHGTLKAQESAGGALLTTVARQTLTMVCRSCQGPATARGRAKDSAGSRSPYCRGAGLTLQYVETGADGTFTFTASSLSVVEIYIGKLIVNPDFDPAYWDGSGVYDPRLYYLTDDPAPASYRGYYPRGAGTTLAERVPDPAWLGGIDTGLFGGSSVPSHLAASDHSDYAGGKNPCDCSTPGTTLLTGVPIGDMLDLDGLIPIPSGNIPLPALAPQRIRARTGQPPGPTAVYAVDKFTIGGGGVQIPE